MSVPHKVQWASVAEDDLKGVIEYIAEDSLENAASVFQKIKDAASGLDRFPERACIVPELKDYGITLYRELIVAQWRVIYRVSGREIYVLSVLDSRQNAEDILLKRFIK